MGAKWWRGGGRGGRQHGQIAAAADGDRERDSAELGRADGVRAVTGGGPRQAAYQEYGMPTRSWAPVLFCTLIRAEAAFSDRTAL